MVVSFVQERLKKTGLLPQQQQSVRPAPLPDIAMDPDFAAMLLAMPLQVVTASWSTSVPSMPGWDESKFRVDLASLRSRELPYFRCALLDSTTRTVGWLSWLLKLSALKGWLPVCCPTLANRCSSGTG